MDAGGNKRLRAAMPSIGGRMLREQRGMTVVEGAVAGLLVVLGALAALALFDTSTRATYRAEESQALNNRLQAELEAVEALPYAEVAMTSQPSPSQDETDPRWRVSGSSFALGHSGTNLEPMVVDSANGAVSPGPEPFQVGDIGGEIFRFVVARNDASCPDALCPGDDVKRIVIAARVDDSAISTDRAFQEVHGEVVDPDAAPVDNPAPPEGGSSNLTGELWLTDTPCSSSTRQPVAADHDTHNTRGECADGMRTGETVGAPDLMATEAPELDSAYPPDGQPSYDYATDVEPELNPELDRGLLLRHGSADGCLLAGDELDMPVAEATPHQKVHKWVSAPVTSGSELLLLGAGTLELWTKTVNGASHPGKLCAWLFVRTQNLQGDRVDVPVVATGNLDYFHYSDESWPAVTTKVAVPLEFTPPGAIEAGERIGLALTVDRAGMQPGDALELIYDHPSFGSRLQLEIDRTLPF